MQKCFLKLCMLLVILLALSCKMTDITTEKNLVASKYGKVYHIPDCRWANRIKPENIVIFNSVKAAEDKGYRACKVCRPIKK